MEKREALGKVVDTLNNVHADIVPADLSAADFSHISLMRAHMAFVNYQKVKEDLEDLAKPEVYAQFVGQDKGKKKLLKKIEKWAQGLSEHANLTDELRDFVRPWRDVTRPQNDNRPHGGMPPNDKSEPKNLRVA